MEFTIEYVLYESEKNNEFINRLKPIHPAVKKIKRTANGVLMEEFYNFSNYKNVRSLNELSQTLNNDEFLIIDLTKIKELDEKSASENQLYEKIRETVNPNHIITYTYHKNDNTRKIGDTLFLIRYDDYNINNINIKNCPLVQVKMHKDETCDWQSISFTSKHKKELDEELSFYNGGYSGLYYLIPNEAIEELDTYFEITKIEDDKWDFIQKKNTKNK